MKLTLTKEEKRMVEKLVGIIQDAYGIDEDDTITTATEGDLLEIEVPKKFLESIVERAVRASSVSVTPISKAPKKRKMAYKKPEILARGNTVIKSSCFNKEAYVDRMTSKKTSYANTNILDFGIKGAVAGASYITEAGEERIAIFDREYIHIMSEPGNVLWKDFHGLRNTQSLSFSDHAIGISIVKSCVNAPRDLLPKLL